MSKIESLSFDFNDAVKDIMNGKNRRNGNVNKLNDSVIDSSDVKDEIIVIQNLDNEILYES